MSDAKKCAWVIDDQKLYRDDLKDTLSRQNFIVRTFNEPVGAMACLESLTKGESTGSLPDVIITDFDFCYGEGDLSGYSPEKWRQYDGQHVTKVMSALDGVRHVPVIFCSGDDTLKYRAWPPKLQVYTMGKALNSPEGFVDVLGKAMGSNAPKGMVVNG